jgi:DNA-directed RNA polymerase subunit M/transcription elongation factor TFIIS
MEAPPKEEKHSTLRFCPVCRGYLFLSSSPSSLIRQCRKCGFSEEDKKGGLVMEMRIQERSSQAYKILINEYTRQDPTLAHIRGPIKCPSAACETNTAGKERDVIPIRWDEKQLKYLYICNVCGIQWRSRD